MDETPIFRITKLNIKENDRGEYIREVENNMHNSIPSEEGTLLIGSAHDDAHGEDNYEIELFRNSLAEDLHIAAAHADDFAETIDKISTDKEIIELKPEDAEKFAHEVKKEMTTSMAAEPGMEIMMSGVNKKNENEWYFVEVYFDDKAYDAHIKSPQYVEYIENTDGMVARRDVKDLVRDTLATQGAIVLD